MNKTKIEYLDYTWNPIAMRCTPVSSGCANCWHLAMAKRLAKNPNLITNKRAAYAGGMFILDKKELQAPLHLKKPSRIGVQFMGDLFHRSVADRVLAIMEMIYLCNQHTFFVLTKRTQEMVDFFERWEIHRVGLDQDFPLNLWLGVSVEDQKTADERIPILFRIPAVHRWVSVEPMLGPVDFHKIKCGPNREILHWVVCGGETGPKARPLHPDWVRNLRDQCQAAGVPFFFKSCGEWLPAETWGECVYGNAKVHCFGPPEKDPLIDPSGWTDGMMVRVGHKASGRLLDGRTWEEYVE
jgi:protein gp37